MNGKWHSNYQKNMFSHHVMKSWSFTQYWHLSMTGDFELFTIVSRFKPLKVYCFSELDVKNTHSPDTWTHGRNIKLMTLLNHRTSGKIGRHIVKFGRNRINLTLFGKHRWKGLVRKGMNTPTSDYRLSCLHVRVLYSYMRCTPDRMNGPFPLTKEQTDNMSLQLTWLENSHVHIISQSIFTECHRGDPAGQDVISNRSK